MRRSRNRIIAVIIAVCMVIMNCAVMGASEWNGILITNGMTLDISTFTTGITNKLVIPKEVKELTIKGNTGLNFDGLVIEAEGGRGESLKLTIENLNIKNGCIDIAKTDESKGGDFLYLKGKNKIDGNTKQTAAVVIAGAGKLLTIEEKQKDAQLEVIGGTGSAGIGTTENSNHGGSVIIKSGKINAQGGSNAAGIGSANRSFGNITITGTAVVVSKGGSNAAGIGAAASSMSGNIIIAGNSNITATGNGGGAGIGAGNSGGLKNIIIKDNAVISSAIGGATAGAGIGGGGQSSHVSETVQIRDNVSILFAKGGDQAAGIGGGNGGAVAILEITGGKIEYAQGGAQAAGIGTGNQGATSINVDVTSIISEKSVIKTMMGSSSRENLIILAGGHIVKAYGGGVNADGTENTTINGGSGIGGGYSRGATILVLDGVLIETAQGGKGCSGIGSGSLGTDPNFIMSGGKIQDAIGGTGGAGIGGGDNRGANVAISGGYIENAKGGEGAAGIGGGEGGKSGNVAITGGIVYAQAGENAPNAIGSGKCGNEGEESQIKLVVTGGDVFLNGDAKGFIPTDEYKKIYFKLYSDWANKVVHQDKDFLIREVIPSAMVGGVQQYDLVFDSDDGTCNNQGIITAILKMPGYDESLLESGNFTEIDNIFHGYWFQYMDGDNVMVGHPAVDASKIDWNIVFETKVVGTITVDDFSKLKQMTIPIEFKPATSVAEPTTIGAVDNSKSKIVPYSISNLTFTVPTESEPNILEVKDLVITMKFNNITSDLECEAAKIKAGVWDKGNYNQTLANALLVQDNGTNEIKVTYPSSMLKTDDFVVALYIPTKHFETDGTKNQAINVYKDLTDANHKLDKEEDVVVTINMKAKVVTKEQIKVPGITETQEVPGAKVMDLAAVNQIVKMKYADFTKIN